MPHYVAIENCSLFHTNSASARLFIRWPTIRRQVKDEIPIQGQRCLEGFGPTERKVLDRLQLECEWGEFIPIRLGSDAILLRAFDDRSLLAELDLGMPDGTGE